MPSFQTAESFSMGKRLTFETQSQEIPFKWNTTPSRSNWLCSRVSWPIFRTQSLFISKSRDSWKNGLFTLQEKSIEKISPEFQRKFPQYRLGIVALKKTWSKIAYFSEPIQTQKGALTEEWKLNIHYLIKENLKHYFYLNPNLLIALLCFQWFLSVLQFYGTSLRIKKIPCIQIGHLF